MIVFVADAFKEDYPGGAELTTEALIDANLLPARKIYSRDLTYQQIEAYKGYHWVFGNFSEVNDLLLLECIKELSYSVLEYDYKFCNYRSVEKHTKAEGECTCAGSVRGKTVAVFLARAKNLWWMSEKQKELYCKVYPFLDHSNSRVLSSIFAPVTLQLIDFLRGEKKKREDKWIILNSGSWIKGADAAVEYAKENNLNYELVWGLDHEDFLKKLSVSKGIIFLPHGGDTCPRFIIEAKLLGCEMILNDNVQHKDEDWFQSDYEDTMSYLWSRASYFWQETEKYINKIPKLNEAKVTEQNYKIIVPFYNVEDWIPKCIDSVERQQYRKFHCRLIDDKSTDKSFLIAKMLSWENSNFSVVENNSKQYALANIVEAIESLKCDDEDVIIIIDGDDWFSSTTVLQKLNEIYSDENCLMTYGSYCYSPSGQRGIEPSEYPKEVIENNAFREDQWRASHLRTFKYKLWKNLKKEDLCDDGGNYYPMTYDQAIMLPLLEMAGDRSKFISDIMYVYNRNNPNNVDKNKATKQYAIAQEIRSKPKHQRIQ